MTETATLTLSDFLRARYREEEMAENRRGIHYSDCARLRDADELGFRPACDCGYSALWLGNEFARLRVVMKVHVPTSNEEHCAECFSPMPCATLRALGTAYEDHQDYRAAEWAL